MDTTLAAGWIAFWGAVGGAVLGAAIAGLANWLAMRWQWAREGRALQLARIDEDVAKLHADLLHLADEMTEERAPADLLRSTRTRAGIVVARARSEHPHLASIVNEAMERIERTYTPPRHDAPENANLMSVVSRVTATFAAPHVHVLAQMLTEWLRDPVAFQKRAQLLPPEDSVRRPQD